MDYVLTAVAGALLALCGVSAWAQGRRIGGHTGTPHTADSRPPSYSRQNERQTYRPSRPSPDGPTPWGPGGPRVHNGQPTIAPNRNPPPVYYRHPKQFNMAPPVPPRMPKAE